MHTICPVRSATAFSGVERTTYKSWFARRIVGVADLILEEEWVLWRNASTLRAAVGCTLAHFERNIATSHGENKSFEQKRTALTQSEQFVFQLAEGHLLGLSCT